MHIFDHNCGLKMEQIADYRNAFQDNPVNRVALNAVTATEMEDTALNREAFTKLDHVFSHQIKTAKATHQKSTGRCWMFAGLNMLRVTAMKNMALEEFELSQNYCMFWDKFERSNYFLECTLRSIDEPVQSRLFEFLMASPLTDGGQWDMFANLIKKHGVVPKTLMPETVSSSKSQFMNRILYFKMRDFSLELRESHRQGAGFDALRRRKEDMMRDVYRILAIHCGEPPTQFQWQYRDKDDNFHRDDDTLTPIRFYEKYIGLDLDDYASLIHCPTEDKPFRKLYTLDYIGNVCEGQPIRYLNVEMETLKQAAVDMIKDGQTVWFGADVSKFMRRKEGILDTKIYDFENLFTISFQMDKGHSVNYRHSVNCHAMLLTGVNLDSKGRPDKWKVENSWGDELGDKGFFVMTDDWFNEYLFQIVVAKKYLSRELLSILEQDPIVLPPWDPMGVLARMQ